MAERTLIAEIRPDEKDSETVLVTSPVVGVADGAPSVGVFLNPFDRIAGLRILNRRYILRLPRTMHGRIVEAFIPNGCTPVAYGDPVVRLDPRAPEAAGHGVGVAHGADGAADVCQDSGLIAVPAPSDGIFYRRPSPDSPPYIEVGAEVTTGSILGLVEIMKCFHQITYGGLDLPDKGVVAKILGEDASEVRFGETLFQIKPL